MKNFRIFTESKADVCFLMCFVAEVLSVELENSDFDTLGAWSGYKTDGMKPSLQENADNKRYSVLIIDADSDFVSRKAEVIADLEKFGIPYKLFLFPNNESSGALEDLLTKIAVERKIIDCFGSYETCIGGYNLPVAKSRIFAYLDALLPKGKKKGDKNDQIQESNRNYRIKEHWDLHHSSLDPLKTFLAAIVGPGSVS